MSLVAFSSGFTYSIIMTISLNWNIKISATFVCFCVKNHEKCSCRFNSPSKMRIVVKTISISEKGENIQFEPSRFEDFEISRTARWRNEENFNPILHIFFLLFLPIIKTPRIAIPSHSRGSQIIALTLRLHVTIYPDFW